MEDRHATKIIITSNWEKDGKVCRVLSERDIVLEPNSRKRVPVPVATFQFSGYNPLPCYSMQSTFEIVSQWMYKNGWKPSGNRSTETFYVTIDTETEEVLLLEREKVITVHS